MVKPILSSIVLFLSGLLLGIILISSSPSGVSSTQADYTPVEVTRQFIAPHDVDCLAKTIFFEARNESLAGKLAVGLVVLNRTESSKFPKTVCAVVEQGRYTGTPIANRATPNAKACQFSWYCDGISDQPKETVAWNNSKEIARVILEQKVFDFTDQATHYHASRIHPRWANSLEKIGQIDGHTFYREK